MCLFHIYNNVQCHVFFMIFPTIIVLATKDVSSNDMIPENNTRISYLLRQDFADKNIVSSLSIRNKTDEYKSIPTYRPVLKYDITHFRD